MNKSDFFKFLFWVLSAAVFCFLCLLLLRIGFTILEGTRVTIYIIMMLALPIIIVAAIFAAITVFIYRDAPKWGMDRWIWMTIAVFVPNFIGLIIYFIIRSSNNTKCFSCGKNIKSEFKICPYCGTPLDTHCPKCGKQVMPDWQVCPHCKQNL